MTSNVVPILDRAVVQTPDLTEQTPRDYIMILTYVNGRRQMFYLDDYEIKDGAVYGIRDLDHVVVVPTRASWMILRTAETTVLGAGAAARQEKVDRDALRVLEAELNPGDRDEEEPGSPRIVFMTPGGAFSGQPAEPPAEDTRPVPGQYV